jgi:mRNA interferase MazF
MVRRYVPDAGDIVWLHFDPQAGHEHAGHRPALVVSPQSYNGKTRLMLCCPMTTQIKGYPFEVRISGKRPGVVLADQVKSLDWVSRKAKHKGKATPAELAEARAKISALIGNS